MTNLRNKLFEAKKRLKQYTRFNNNPLAQKSCEEYIREIEFMMAAK